MTPSKRAVAWLRAQRLHAQAGTRLSQALQAVLVAAGVVTCLLLIILVSLLGLHKVVSDETLGSWAETALNNNLPGTFSIGGLHWELPLSFEILNAEVEDVEGNPAIRVDKVAARIDPWALLHLDINVKPVRVTNARVVVHQSSPTARVNLEATFVENPNGPLEDGPNPWSVTLDDIGVQSSHLIVNVPGAYLTVRNISVENSRLSIRDHELAVDAQVATQAILKLGKTRLPFAHVTVRVEGSRYHFGGDRRDVEAQLVALQADGIRVRAHGKMEARLHSVDKFDTHYDIHADPQRIALLPADLRKMLRGQADFSLDLRGSDAQQRFDVQMQGRALSARDIQVSRLTASGFFNAPQLSFQNLSLHTGAGTLEGRGHFNLTADGVGAHDLQVGLTDVPLRRLLEPYTQAGPVIPQRVMAEISAKGPGLMPLGSRMELHLIGSGIAAAFLPGVPDPMELHGRMLLASKGMRIEMLALRGEGLDFAVHGEVPWKIDSLVGVLLQFKGMPKGRTNKQLMPPLGDRRTRPSGVRLARSF